MCTSAIVGRLANCVLLILTMAVITTSKKQESGCFYYYIQQPRSDVSCNPWPYINYYSGNSLVLHCDLLGPQNNDILNVVWYREVYTGDDSQLQRISPSSSDSEYSGKFNSPNSSGDITHGFKRINFTLFVNNASDADVGCYWCEITIRTGNCSVTMSKSSVFCLRKKSLYRNKKPCSILSVNSSVVCAANTTCDTPPASWMGDPYLILDDGKGLPAPSKSIPPNVIWPQLLTNGGLDVRTTSLFNSNSINSLSTLQTSQQQLGVTTDSIQGTSSLSYNHTRLQKSTTLVSESFKLKMSLLSLESVTASYTSESDQQGILPTSVSSDSNSVSATLSLSSLPSYEDTNGNTVTSVITLNGATERDTQPGGTTVNLRISPVQIGVFIGIAVCAVLFAIISMLVFGVVMLCKKTEQKKPSSSRNNNHQGGRRPTHSNGRTESFMTAWRQDVNPLPTSIVNSGHVISPRSVPTYYDIPATISCEVETNGRPYISEPIASLPTLLNISSRWKTHSLPLLPDRRASINNRVSQLSQSHHHASLEGEIRRNFNRRSTGSTALRSRSPDQHYYHVLERPDYYNCTWLEGEDSDEYESAVGGTDKTNKRVTIEGDESDNDSLYHWRVVLTSSTREEAQDLDRSSSSKRAARHLYRRLNHSTLEPVQDYAKVSIGHQNSDGDEPHHVV